MRPWLALPLGMAAVLCFAPFELYLLAPPLLLGLFLLLKQAEDGRSAALTGAAFGGGLMLAGASWIYVSLHDVGGMPAPVAALAVLALALVVAVFPAVSGGLFWRLGQHWQARHGEMPGPLRQALWFAVLFALADWWRTWFLTGFPWLLLGYTQAPPSPLAAWGAIVGVHGLGLLLLLTSALWCRWRVGLPASLLFWGLAFLLPGISWTVPDGVPLSYSLVQGNVPQDLKFQPERLFATLNRYREMANAANGQLVVLPETALPVFVDQLDEDYLDGLTAGVRARGGDLLLGVVSADGRRYFNSALSLGSSPSQIYRKTHLVPFGEFIPLGFRWFVEMANIPLGEFARGDAVQPPLALAGTRVAVNICYEDVFGEELRGAAGEAGVMVNLTNTAWFGHSLAQPQHLQMARLRAVEAGRPLLRATNTGVTAAIDGQGRLLGVLPEFSLAILQGEVQPMQGQTPYLRFGNLGFFLLAGGLMLLGTRRFNRA